LMVPDLLFEPHPASIRPATSNIATANFFMIGISLWFSVGRGASEVGTIRDAPWSTNGCKGLIVYCDAHVSCAAAPVFIAPWSLIAAMWP
jgi:hypothetical protein